MQVRSDLWLDQPDAHEQIEARLSTDALTAEEAEKLHHFVDEGYLTLRSVSTSPSVTDSTTRSARSGNSGPRTSPFHHRVPEARPRSATTTDRYASAATASPIFMGMPTVPGRST